MDQLDMVEVQNAEHIAKREELERDIKNITLKQRVQIAKMMPVVQYAAAETMRMMIKLYFVSTAICQFIRAASVSRSCQSMTGCVTTA